MTALQAEIVQIEETRVLSEGTSGIIASSDNSEENLEVEEDDAFYQDNMMLVEYGINIDDIKKLKASGINTIKGIQMLTRKKLLQIEGLTENKVDQIYDACFKIPSAAFTTALEAIDQRKQIFKLITGSKNLDQLLGGGIESMSITEVFGEFATGKTQIAHTLCVTAQLPNASGYTGGKVIFIDTENTFRPEKLTKIAERFNLDHRSVLKNVLYNRAFTSEHQYRMLNNVCNMLHDEAGVFKLLIIDSIMALFRVDFCGMGEIADRQRKVGQMMSRLQKISEEYNIAVFITNQVTSDFTHLEQSVELQKPVGGHILAHASTTRISLHKIDNDDKRVAKVYDSPSLPRSETEFFITSSGIADIA